MPVFSGEVRMQSKRHPATENLRQDYDNNEEMEVALSDQDIEQTLQERIEAGELTQMIIERGLLDDTH
jgi:hypothetical protein